ncbi:polyprenyl synthetase family protein [Gudongella oleilytica]|jgi:geranylgeranyl diphosphate synthase type II|uniref:polyprenyl synthetase family protein n=1 Tax=Gudongella oleilytica TaxID=1582259 RepID=UPI000FF891F3|nr:farnesyl diphosphate synthase [Gudongella oleilytica]
MRATDNRNEYLRLIDEGLMNAIKSRTPYELEISQAMEYSLFTGGKRLRPLMTIKAYEMYHDYIYKALPYAIAIEMIHTYSLIHDDLPAMDNDDYRRGKLTSHKVFGEAMAILAGDGLLNLAFETMLSAAKESCDMESIKAMQEIARASGCKGMIGGQAIDLRSELESMDEESLLFMYKSKTAALIQASIISGAILGGADSEHIEKLRDFGLRLGLAYQIQDDLLDDEKDESIEKCTYLSFHSREEAEKKVLELSNRAVSILDSLDEVDTSFFRDLTLELAGRQV